MNEQELLCYKCHKTLGFVQWRIESDLTEEQKEVMKKEGGWVRWFGGEVEYVGLERAEEVKQKNEEFWSSKDRLINQ